MVEVKKVSYSPTKRRLAAVFLLALAAVIFIYDAAPLWNDRVPELLRLKGLLAEGYRLGLDLQGGTHLVYEADLSAIAGGEKSEAMQGLRDVVERRVNRFGVTEPVVQVNNVGDSWRLIVELAGVKDVNQAIQFIGRTPLLEFREPRIASSTEEILAAQQKGEQLNIDPYFKPNAELTGRYLSRAEVQFDPNTQTPLIGLQFNDEGALIFEELTKKYIGQPIGIYLDGILRSAPNVNEAISGGQAVITGQFTVPEARSIVRDLNSGALPVPISLISQQTVEASLGRESLRDSLKAGAIGFLIVAVFMMLWYRLPGILAVVALLVYAVLSLALFKMLGVTFSVAAIAGFILSIGMAVDANILIFERTKEELRRGKGLADALHEGFDRAWTSIRDSNVSSLITAVILYWLGTSVVRGFATTLALGILISMFTALTVSKTFLLATLFKKSPKILYFSGFSKPKS